MKHPAKLHPVINFTVTGFNYEPSFNTSLIHQSHHGMKPTNVSIHTSTCCTSTWKYCYQWHAHKLYFIFNQPYYTKVTHEWNGETKFTPPFIIVPLHAGISNIRG